MTKKYYYKDPNLDNLKTRILSITQGSKFAEVILEETIFYPEGGGQPADTGKISGFHVVDVQIKGDKTIHYVDLKILEQYSDNDYVDLDLDRERRNDNTIQHSAQHLLSAILFDQYKTQTLSFHLGKEYSTIDIDSTYFEPELLSTVEDLCNDAVFQNINVTDKVFDRLEQIEGRKLRKQPKVKTNIRIVEIEGYDASPCGGTHVKSTGRIGLIKLLKLENYKSNYRLYFIAGKRVLKDYRNKSAIVNYLTEIYSCHQNDVISKFDKENIKTKVMKKNLIELRIASAKEFAEKINSISDSKIIIEMNKSYHDADFVNETKKYIANGKVILFTFCEELRVSLFSTDKNFNVRDFFRANLSKFNGKGGGGKEFGNAVWGDKSEYEKYINFFAAI
jgi:alanyl-tRNA synthetase